MHELTEWIPSDVSPVRRGVYEIRCDDLGGMTFYNWWNGRRWSSGGYSDPVEAAAHKRDRQNDPVDAWRGLKGPNEPS